MISIFHISFFDLLLSIALFTFFLVQIAYWINYSRILSYLSKPSTNQTIPPVSVIIVVNNTHAEWIKNGMCSLFKQDHPKYEVVIVNDGGGEEISSLLQLKSVEYPILKYTEIVPDRKYAHTIKVAKLVGIKSAKNDNLLFVEPWNTPSSTHWLSQMAMGFTQDKDVVVGMSLPVQDSKWWNGLARSFEMMSLLRCSKAAILGKPYRASMSNFGFKKQFFFSTGGYNFLITGLGDNDLYLQKISKSGNTSFVLSKDSIMQQSLPEKFKWWIWNLSYSTYLFRYYRKGVKLGVFFYLFSLLLFWALLVFSVVRFRFDIVLLSFVFSVLVLRQTTVYSIFGFASKKLGQKRMFGHFVIYDIIAPLWEMLLFFIRRFGAPSRGI